MTHVRDTSVAAYQDVQAHLGEKQQVVLTVLQDTPNMTNTEIAQSLGWPINTVTPRVYELRNLGLVREIGKRMCKVTGKSVYAWEPVYETPLI